jgi:hypothetical protein
MAFLFWLSLKFGDSSFCQSPIFFLFPPSFFHDATSLLDLGPRIFFLILSAEPFRASCGLVPWFVCRNALSWLGIVPPLLILHVFLLLLSLVQSHEENIVAQFFPRALCVAALWVAAQILVSTSGFLWNPGYFR